MDNHYTCETKRAGRESRATRATRATNDPLPGLVSEWRTATAELIAEGAKPGAGNYDTPECIALASRRCELGLQIPHTKPQSLHGAVALFEWAEKNGLGGDAWHPDQPKAQRAAISYLKGFAESATP